MINKLHALINESGENHYHFISGLFSKNKSVTFFNEVVSQIICYLLNRLNIPYRLDSRSGYQISLLDDPDGNIVKDVVFLGKITDYVYDIETENSSFHAGIGNLVIHNTDSIFIRFRSYKGDHTKTDKEKIEESMKLGLEYGALITNYLNKPGLVLEYEKILYKFFLFSKKRYLALLYEDDPEKYVIKSMGIVTKRRDNAPIVKDMFNRLFDIIINTNVNIMEDVIIKFVKEFLTKTCGGGFDLNKFIVTKTLKGNYKAPQSIAHKVLADRMKGRDPGNCPQINDRIPYAYVRVKETKNMLQGDRIEHRDYIKENELKIDYAIYIKNQLKKPICQLLSLVIKDPDKMFDVYIRKEENKKKGYREIDTWFS
jgi:DNA polymerase elongation subunit (family B)